MSPLVVAGGGIVGLAAALALHQAGLAPSLVEPQALPDAPPAEPDPRVYALSPASIGLLQALGVWEGLPRVQPYHRMQVWDDHPQRALRFEAPAWGSPLGAIVEHGALLAALAAAVGRAGLPLQADRALHYAAAEQRLTLASGRHLPAALLLAADGAASPLREAAGIPVEQLAYPQQALVATVRSERAHEGAALQRFLPGGPLALLPLASGERSIVWSLPPEEAQRLQALDEARFARELARAAQDEVGAILAVGPRQRVPLQRLQAQRYVQDGLVLLGDAAHVIHPLAGQGLNLGLGDVADLARRLGTAWREGRDPGSPRLLQAYARARRAESEDLLRLTDALYRVYGLDLPGLRPLLGWGLGLVDRLPPVKQVLLSRALG
ncbi:MAG TPA: FAD-dependent monooxygenase [Nevskiaceae bacterium]|nr:FAD-dependent monooxygenase [Nevskiaceae bacterium]